MPPESVWLQYSIVSILILAAGVIAAAFYRLWRDLLNWFEAQDSKREIEREKHRSWQADQDKVRDLRWQEFLKSMQDEWMQQDGRHVEVLRQLSIKVDCLLAAVNNHDTWSRASKDKSQ
jgi:hypothetical protein